MPDLPPEIVIPAGNKRIRAVVSRRFIPDFERNFEDAARVGGAATLVAAAHACGCWSGN
jgi:hypothetical protein